jgi:hypothetical protein
MQYENTHLLSGRGCLQEPQGERTPVFYVLRTMDAFIGSRDRIPIGEEVDVIEIDCKEDAGFANRHRGKLLVLELSDERTIEVEWRGAW